METINANNEKVANIDISNLTTEPISILPIQTTVVFPSLVMPLMVAEARFTKLVDETLMDGKPLGLFTQKDPGKENINSDDIYRVGVAGHILKMLRFPDGSVRFLVQGISRIKIKKFVETEPFLKADVEVPKEIFDESIETEALMRNVLEQLANVTKLAPYLPDDLQVSAYNTSEPSKLADLIASNLNISIAEKQEVLEIFDVKKRLLKVNMMINKELQVLETSRKIQTDAASEMGKSQRDYILREQLKAIQKELGEADDRMLEIEDIKKKIKTANMPDEAREASEKELDRLSKMNPSAAEYTVSRTYLDWLVNLPWSVSTEDILDIKAAQKVLNEDHYDLDKVKERILEYLAVRKLNSDLKGPILCFVGPPGVGKTSLGMSIARAMGRKFFRMSLGGVRDEAEVRGHRRTYIGALPGRIIQGIRKSGSNNPVFMLDEVDKIGQDFRGDPSSALLEVLDPEQNFSFADHYLDVNFDLTKVMFITTANILETIPAVLLDRMEVITLPGYTDLEKLAIAKKFLIPRNLTDHGLTLKNLTFTDKAIKNVVSDYTRESGLRNLNRELGTICRKVARKVAAEEVIYTNVTPKLVQEFLGPEKYFQDFAEKIPSIGVVPGLAWTSAGGEILFIEAAAMPGKKDLKLTGQLGDVMKESVMTALSYLRSISDQLGIEQSYFTTHDFHVHVPAGATPKDGPSAGVTMFTALASLATNTPIAPYMAMTGEITLRGDVLPIGGLKQKALAAFRAGIKTILFPKKNKRDLIEIPKEITNKITFVPVENIDDILENALGLKLKKVASKEKKIKTTSKKLKKKSTKKAAKKKR
ncbi:MAG: endopeptidase La [candidate division Zixibacteria bacterium]|nr:endopeptidase La [candidate division Zixibacteria bacterium]